MKYANQNDKTYKQYVLETIKEICPFKKKSIYDYEYYYDMILIVLKDVNSWRSLKVTINYRDKKENHYTTIRKMFNKWNKMDIFKIAYERMLENKVIKRIQSEKSVINLFIDSTFDDRNKPI